MTTKAKLITLRLDIVVDEVELKDSKKLFDASVNHRDMSVIDVTKGQFYCFFTNIAVPMDAPLDKQIIYTMLDVAQQYIAQNPVNENKMLTQEQYVNDIIIRQLQELVPGIVITQDPNKLNELHNRAN